jgi:hypothetical protein
VVEVATAVEDARVDPGLLRRSRERLADGLGLCGLVALERLPEPEMRRRGDRPARAVIDELRLDAAVGTSKAIPVRGLIVTVCE